MSGGTSNGPIGIGYKRDECLIHERRFNDSNYLINIINAVKAVNQNQDRNLYLITYSDEESILDRFRKRSITLPPDHLMGILNTRLINNIGQSSYLDGIHKIFIEKEDDKNLYHHNIEARLIKALKIPILGFIECTEIKTNLEFVVDRELKI